MTTTAHDDAPLFFRQFRITMFLSSKRVAAASSLGVVLMLVFGPSTSARSQPRSAGGVTVVTDKATADRFMHALQKSLSRIVPRGKILSCGLVVRSDEYAGQDEIYGASCLVSTGEPKPLRLLMCDDMMVRKFTLTDQYFWGVPPLETIGAFVRTNCPAGG